MPSGKDLYSRIPEVRRLQRGKRGGAEPDLKDRNYLTEEELVDFDQLKKKLSMFRIAPCKTCKRDIPKDPKIDFCSIDCKEKDSCSESSDSSGTSTSRPS